MQLLLQFVAWRACPQHALTRERESCVSPPACCCCYCCCCFIIGTHALTFNIHQHLPQCVLTFHTLTQAAASSKNHEINSATAARMSILKGFTQPAPLGARARARAAPARGHVRAMSAACMRQSSTAAETAAHRYNSGCVMQSAALQHKQRLAREQGMQVAHALHPAFFARLSRRGRCIFDDTITPFMYRIQYFSP